MSDGRVSAKDKGSQGGEIIKAMVSPCNSDVFHFATLFENLVVGVSV